MLDAVIELFAITGLKLRPIRRSCCLKMFTEELRKADDSEPFSALAFKIATDPFVGKFDVL